MVIKLKSLSYSTEHKEVLKNLNLDIKEGKIIAVLGANGSGKSTLLKLIAGLLEPDRGAVFFNNHKVPGPEATLVPGHPQISLVKQDSGLFPLHSVRENLQYILQSHHKKIQSEKITLLSKLLDLEVNLDRKLKFLSGGEQQRVAIAAALASGPELLLLDEPFSQTDMYLKNHLKNHLQEIVNQLGIGILYVTHEPSDAVGFADEILILDKGKIAEKGSSHEVYYRPRKESTAILTGYCNWLPVGQFHAETKLHRIKNNYLVRPDQISFDPRKEEDSLSGKIVKIDFHGIYQLIHLSLPNQQALVAAHISHSRSFKIGQEVNISLRDNNAV